MTQKLVMLLSAEAGNSPAELLFGSTPLVASTDLPLTENSSRHLLSRAEAALRDHQLVECARLTSRALHRLPHESRALASEEWLLLAGLSLLNGNLESSEHQLQMAARRLHQVRAVHAREFLSQRIAMIRSLHAGVCDAEAGLTELLTVFRFLGTTRCPELCVQAMRVRDILLKWTAEEGIEFDAIGNGTVPHMSWPHQRNASPLNPEWN